MRFGSVQLSKWFLIKVFGGFVVVMTMGVMAFVVVRVGIKESGYVISSIFKEVVYRDGSLTKFQKKVDTDGKKEYAEDTLEVQGFMLSSSIDGGMWLLSPVYGLLHFVPLTDRQVIYYTMDECKDEDIYTQIWKERGKITIAQEKYFGISTWIEANKKLRRPFVVVSYLKEDDTKTTKRYRHVHSSDGLIYLNIQKDKLCPTH